MTQIRGYITDYKPHDSTRMLLGSVDAVLDDYRDYWPLTIRQIFYALIGQHGYTKSEKLYNRLVEHIGNARRARWIPFSAIRDDGGTEGGGGGFSGLGEFEEFLAGYRKYYHRDLQVAQPCFLEVWCETAGMVSQLTDVTRDYTVPVYSGGGFSSLTGVHRAARRIAARGRKTVLLHLGDYDPSGLAIFQQVAEDVAAFVEVERTLQTDTFEAVRVALNADQVAKYNLVTQPVNQKDTRAATWEGETCQLEALPPDVVAGLLRAAIERHRDMTILEGVKEVEKHEKQTLLNPGKNGGE